MWMTLLANGLAFGLLLFLIASGLTLIFGVLRIVNLAHGSLYMLAAYVGVAVAAATGSFTAAAAAGALLTGLVGFVVHRFLLRGMRGELLPQVLVSMGVLLIISDVTLMFWGGMPQRLVEPSFLRGPLFLGGLVFPKYRVFVALFSLAVAVILWFLMERTRLGAMVRAVVDDAETAAALGTPVPVVTGAVFTVGAALAGLGGVLGSPFLGVYPGIDLELLTLALAVVIIGGLGNLGGTLAASVLVGVADNFGKVYLPELAYITFFGPMVLLLIFRPQGLFGRR